jgi:hypothetical protein
VPGASRIARTAERVVKTTKIDAVTLGGASGKQYEFRVYVWDTKFKALPGVYVVASRTLEPGQSPRYESLFVGSSPDLSKAFKSHPRGDCFQMYYANVIGVLKESDAGARENISADLIESLAPPCNADDAE